MKRVILFSFLLFLVSSCEDNQEQTIPVDNVTVVIGKQNYIYKGENIEITYKLNSDNDKIALEDSSSLLLSEIFKNNPTLIEVYGLDDSGSIYLFDDVKEEQKFYKTGRGCSMLKYATGKDSCGGGTGGGGTGGGTSSLTYNSQNLRIYADSYLNKEIDWTSYCYYYTGSTNNKKRMKDFNKNETNAWRFRNNGISCFPSGFSNMSDVLSSLQVSQSVALVTLYQDHNYEGRSKKFYRRDVGLKDPEDHGGYPYWQINNVTKWMEIGRLKNFKIGLFGTSSWDDRVSSIKIE
jgi:hypothetical protein